MNDIFFMQQALAQAQIAYDQGEVPVGAVLVENGQIIARAHNRVQKEKKAIAHAELLVLEKGFALKKEKYLPAATLYVTLEPCPMCAMACSWSQVGRIVYGATDPKRGYHLWQPSLLFPKIQVTQGPLAQESQEMLQSFFQALRHKSPT